MKAQDPSSAPPALSPAPPRALRVVMVVLALLIAASVATAYFSGAFSEVSDPASFAASVARIGAWGYVAFVVAYALLQPFGVPGTVFVVAAPLIWPWPVAFALSMTGTMAASVIGFSFARFVARDWIATRIPSRFKKYDDALGRSAFVTVAVLRMILWMPQPLHWFFGVSKVRFSTHFWGSLVGYAAPLFVVSYFGAKVFDAQGKMQPGAWPILGGMLVASLVVAGAARLYDRRVRARALNAPG